MKKGLKIFLVVLIGLLLAADLGGGAYLFNFAFKKGNYSSKDANIALKGNNKWFADQKQIIWTEKSKDNLKLKARFLPAARKTNKTVLVIHGYGSASKYMGSYIRTFHEAGYNVLAPDNRSFGLSQGEYAGYGWKDRSDIMEWINRLNKRNPNSKIGMFGVSMGAATVLYTLGEHPKNVDFAIADCGYSTISGELNYQLKEMFNLPSFPLVPTAAIYSKALAGYNFYQADTKKTLKNSHVPLFIIHGSKDSFVPVSNAYINYKNANSPKKLWIVKNAEHAKSYQTDKKDYVRKVDDFAQKYFK